jgi:hypothetical protein
MAYIPKEEKKPMHPEANLKLFREVEREGLKESTKRNCLKVYKRNFPKP